MTSYEFRRRAAISILLFLIVSGGILAVQFVTLQNRAPLVPRTMELIGTKVSSTASEPVLSAAKRRLAIAPNDPQSLNLLYVDAINSDPKGPAAKYIGTLLSQLGWRYSSAQQNLILTATAEENFEAIIKNSDALLRRDQASDQILALLRLVEVEPDTRPYLVRQLALNPPWKSKFLRKSSTLTTGTQTRARGQTLEMMLADGQKIDRLDFAPSLNAMIQTGEMDLAWDLYRAYSKPTGRSIINDQDFVQLAQSRNISEYRPLPFEWQNHSTRGLQISATESIGKAELQVRWNGRGTPLMLSQYVKIPGQSLYQLELTGLDAKPGLAKIVQFSLACGQGVVRFEDVQEDLKAGKITLSTEQPVACKFPRFEIRGRIQDIARPQTISLSSVHLSPKS